MKEFTLEACNQLHEQIQEALDTIAARNGLRAIKALDVKNNSFKMSFKIDAIIDQEIDRDLLIKAAAEIGLPSDYLDKTYSIAQKKLKIIGFEPGIKPVVLEDAQTFERYCLSVNKLKEVVAGMEKAEAAG
jgi:tRNA threonylcarbamoyladenosine modification (KEOPS) complex Cgi121 subunit